MFVILFFKKKSGFGNRIDGENYNECVVRKVNEWLMKDGKVLLVK